MWQLALVLGTCVFSLAISSSDALSCLPCDERSCTNPKDLKCDWGIVRDLCFCCNVCAKGPGEVCGGPFEEKGKCGVGQTCATPEGVQFPVEGKCVRKFLPNHPHPAIPKNPPLFINF